jgi:hypothetical protein
LRWRKSAKHSGLPVNLLINPAAIWLRELWSCRLLKYRLRSNLSPLGLIEIIFIRSFQLSPPPISIKHTPIIFRNIFLFSFIIIVNISKQEIHSALKILKKVLMIQIGVSVFYWNIKKAPLYVNI